MEFTCFYMFEHKKAVPFKKPRCATSTNLTMSEMVSVSLSVSSFVTLGLGGPIQGVAPYRGYPNTQFCMVLHWFSPRFWVVSTWILHVLYV